MPYTTLPKTSNGQNVLIQSSSGVTTLIWGTDGMMISPTPGGTFAGTGYYIVESIDQETDAETIYIENGSGQKAARIQIINGMKWTLSVQDDTGMTPPTVGSTAVILDGARLISNTAGGATVTNCRVIASGEKFTRKGVAVRNISVEKLALVD